MEMNRFCKECDHRKIFQHFCLFCMKNTLNKINLDLQESFPLRDSTILKQKSPGLKKFVEETRVGWFKSNKYHNGVHTERTANKKNDQYNEVIKDYKTGKIIHECHEKLSDHTGHGSAKQ